MTPSLPFLVGAGFVVAVPTAVAGFIAVTRSGLSPVALALGVGLGTAGTLTALLVSPGARLVPVGIALAALAVFPLYALFWTLHDFVEVSVR